jgi:hypothetical protein
MTDAIQKSGFIAAKRKLWQWRVGLYREHLPFGDCWVVTNCPEHYEFQVRYALAEKMRDTDNVRVIFGRPAFWSVAVAEVTESGQDGELVQRLSGRLTIYDPLTYHAWGRLLLKKGRSLDAGKYFLFSGLYDDSERPHVEQFKLSLQQAHTRGILGRMPSACRQKSARRQFPAKVFEDLAGLPCPEWLKHRPRDWFFESPRRPEAAAQ